MAELVAKNNNASLASLNNNNDEELFLFLNDILKRAENSTNILDFTEAELKQTSAAIKQLNLVLVKTRYYHLRSYKSCFIGKDFVNALCDEKFTKFPNNRKTATLLGNYLLRGGLLHHVCDDHVFKDDYLFYRFYSDDIRDAIRRSSLPPVIGFRRRLQSSMSEDSTSVDSNSNNSSVEEKNVELPDMAQLARLARKHLPISDRRYHLKIYHNAFTGKELVNIFIDNGITDTRPHATLLGRALWTAGFIHHVHDDHQFSDRGFFYRFYQDEDYFTFMDSISWKNERKPGFPQNKWEPIKEDENIEWRIVPHTAHTSILFEPEILDDKYLCNNYNAKYKGNIRNRVTNLLYDTCRCERNNDDANNDRGQKSNFAWEPVSSNNKSKDESSNISIYKLAVDRNEKPTVLKRVEYISTKRATNFLLSILSDGAVGDRQNWLIDEEHKVRKLSGSKDCIDVETLSKYVKSNNPNDLKCINQEGQQAVVIRKEKNINALLPISHSCIVQDTFRIEDATMAKQYGFPIGTCIIYEFSIEHINVNSRHLDAKENLNYCRPKVCPVTHFIHDQFDDQFYKIKRLKTKEKNYFNMKGSNKTDGQSSSLKKSMSNLFKRKVPNVEKEILLNAWAIEPPAEKKENDGSIDAKCKVTLLSQTIFGGKKLPFWIECEVLRHHPVFDGLMTDKRDAKRIYVRKTAIQSSEKAETSVEISLSDFEIMAVLGRGGYGKVLQVKLNKEKNINNDSNNNNNNEEEKIFAMKAIKREAVKDGDSQERLILERLILTELHHPFITSLEYAFHTSTKLYMVMEFVAGGDLFTHIHAVKGFTEERILDHASEIVLGVEALHQNKVIYRDLKPENILLDHKGHIKLVDFGLSYRGEENNALRTESFCGTEKYMAPEQLLNRQYGAAIDWWSLGIVIAEMVSGGKHPFAGRNRLQTCRNMVTKKQTYVRRLKGVPPVSKELISLMNGFLEKKEGDRLGYGSKGFLRIKKMQFFSDANGDPLDWDDVIECKRDLTFTPDVTGASDLKYFDDIFTDEKPVDSFVPGENGNVKQKSWFHGVWPFGTKANNNTKKGLTKNNKSQFEESFDYSPQAKKQ